MHLWQIGPLVVHRILGISYFTLKYGLGKCSFCNVVFLHYSTYSTKLLVHKEIHSTYFEKISIEMAKNKAFFFWCDNSYLASLRQ